MFDLLGITLWAQHEDPTPSAHECLKPLEPRNLLIDKGEKGFCFVHRYE